MKKITVGRERAQIKIKQNVTEGRRDKQKTAWNYRRSRKPTRNKARKY